MLFSTLVLWAMPPIILLGWQNHLLHDGAVLPALSVQRLVSLLPCWLFFQLLDEPGKWEVGHVLDFGRTGGKVEKRKQAFATHSWLISDFRLSRFRDFNSLQLKFPPFLLVARRICLFTYALAVVPGGAPCPSFSPPTACWALPATGGYGILCSAGNQSHRELHQQLGGWGFLLIKIAFACFALKVVQAGGW